MKLVLREFQTEAVEKLSARLATAQSLYSSGPQAVLLSAPTGSGKTVAATALIEGLLDGTEDSPGDPDLTFLWLTDQPELNKQTLDKMASTSSTLDSVLVTIDASLDVEALAPGHIYFLNTQKLGSGTSYIKHGDGRTWTLWETIQNTINRDPQRFVLIIDEAHRGTQGREAENADTILMKFLGGSVGELDAVPLVLGISATPDKFVKLCGELGRPLWQVVVDPQDVRESGLIKDVVDLYHPDEAAPSHVTMLQLGIQDWKQYQKAWAQYGADEKEDVPRPVLLVQVEDAKAGHSALSQTDLDLVVRTLRDGLGPEEGDAWIAHAFQDDVAVEAGGISVRYLAPSAIDADPDVQVVLFKTSLNTGWDCPRAEVMVSFRTAQDETNIAQLVGRMVRAPLARRIESQEFLNSVALYLPFYDRTSVERVVERLTSDSFNVPPTKVRIGGTSETLTRAPDTDAVFAVLAQLPTYTVARKRMTKPVVRLARLAALLAETGLSSEPVKEYREHLVKVLLDERTRLAADRAFVSLLEETSVLDIRLRRVEYSRIGIVEDALKAAEAAVVAAEAESEASGVGVPAEAPESVKVRIADQNLNDLYNDAGRRLGEGLHRAYARMRLDAGVEVRDAKLELAALVATAGVVEKVEAAAHALRTKWVGQYKAAFNTLPEKYGASLREIEGASVDPVLTTLTLPTTIEGNKDGKSWPEHVYIAADGSFHEDFAKSSWERKVVEEETKRPEVVGWLRNPDRKPYSLCFSYRQGAKWVPVYPDFVVVRQTDGGLLADIIDPHLLSDQHAPARAAGLAKFAADHSDKFGRIELVIVEGARTVRIDLVQESWRTKVANVTTHAHLKQLFDGA